MNLGENRIEMRIPRSAWFLAIYVSRIPKPLLIEFITASRVYANIKGPLSARPHEAAHGGNKWDCLVWLSWWWVSSPFLFLPFCYQ